MRVVWITHNYPRHTGDVAGGFLHPLAVALRRPGTSMSGWLRRAMRGRAGGLNSMACP